MVSPSRNPKRKSSSMRVLYVAIAANASVLRALDYATRELQMKEFVRDIAKIAGLLK